MNYLENIKREFLNKYFSESSSISNTEKILSTVVSITSEIDNDLESIKFINQILESNEINYKKHLITCTDKINCPTNFRHEKISFKLSKMLNNFGFIQFNDDVFTKEEKDFTNTKLIEILKDLQTIKDGQEIIFNEISELKNLYFLGKRNWRQIAVGKFQDMVVGGVIGETLSKDIVLNISEGLPKILEELR